MKSKNIIFIILVCLLYFSPNVALAQANKGGDVEITVAVTNAENRPISGVQVSIDGDSNQYVTNEMGLVKLVCNKSKEVVFTADGYVTSYFKAKKLKQQPLVQLTTDEYNLFEEVDMVTVAFGEEDKNQSVKSIVSLKPDEYKDYNSTKSVIDLLQIQGVGVNGWGSVRGNSVIYIIDGFVRENDDLASFITNINIEEIEEVTVLKDAVSRTLYGQYGDAPIVLITTKRGKVGRNEFNVSYESNISKPISMPEYMDAADYMTYYNYARANDNGYVSDPLYTEEQINNTRDGVNPTLYPDNNLLTDEFINDFKTSNRLVADFSGGTSSTKYYINMGWTGQSSILNIDDYDQTNRFNIRGNLDTKINSFITAHIDGVYSMTKADSPKYKSSTFWAMTSSFLPNDYPYLIPVDEVSSDYADVIGAAKLIDGQYILGGKSGYEQNPYGDLFLGGYSKVTYAFTEFNAGLDFDLGKLVKGLTYTTKVAFDEYNYYNVSQSNTYAVYFIDREGDGSASTGSDGGLCITQGTTNNSFTGDQSGSGQLFYQNLGFSNVINYDYNKGKHDLNAKLTSFMDIRILDNSLYTDKMANFGVNANYIYDKRYAIEAVTTFQGTSRIVNPWGNSSSVGLGWIASNESFMEDVDFIDHLKVNGSYGIIKTDREGTFATDAGRMIAYDTYSASGSFTFIEGSNKSIGALIVNNRSNPDLDWIGRKEFNVGLDAFMLDKSLHLEANYFYSQRFNNVVKLSNSYPLYYGPTEFIQYVNYGASSNKGFEVGLTYAKQFNDWRVMASVNYITYEGTIDEVDELDYGEGLEHRQTLGAISDAIRGLVCEGIYTQAEVDAIDGTPENPTPGYGTVQAGDLKYSDITGDGKVDDDDIKIIGNWNHRHTYSFALNLGYKNFDFYLQGRAQTGGQTNVSSNSYWGAVYDLTKYPERLKDSWIYIPEEGIDTRETASYPRLSASTIANNSKTSTFWLRDNDYLSISAMQLTYSLPQSITSRWLINNVDIYVRGENLLYFSAEKERLQLNVGSEPQYSSFMAGLKLNF